MKKKLTVKHLCMFEAAIACNEAGKDYLIDTPEFKRIYTELYRTVIDKKRPDSWSQLTEQGKKHFCEHVVSTVKTAKVLQEFETTTGAALGAGAGALGSAGIWAYKRLQLRKQMQQCPDEACKAQVQQQIVDLRNKALKMGAAATAGGAALGFGAATGANVLDKQQEVASTGASARGAEERALQSKLANEKMRDTVREYQKDMRPGDPNMWPEKMYDARRTIDNMAGNADVNAKMQRHFADEAQARKPWIR